MATHKRLVDKLDELFADVPPEEIPNAMGSKESLLKAFAKAKDQDVNELHTLADIRERELEQERAVHQNRRWKYSLFGNVSGAALGAWVGFIQEPLESVRDVVSKTIISGANEIDPRYVGHLAGEFADSLSYTVDQASRLPGAVVAGVLGWIVVGYLARKMFDRRRDVRDTENQYYWAQALKLCSREVMEGRYGRRE